MEVEELVQLLRSKSDEAHAQYVRLHEQLKPYCGRVPTDQEYEEACAITDQIQHVFAREIFPIVSFVIQRAEYAVNITNDYNGWLDRLQSKVDPTAEISNEPRIRGYKPLVDQHGKPLF